MLRFVIIFTFLSLYFVSYSQKYNAELLKSYTENELGGTLVEEGVYFYKIKAKFLGGEDVNLHGFVHLKY
jgi:hypothetical protein